MLTDPEKIAAKPDQVNAVALLQKMLDETPDYFGSDPRADFYRKRRAALKAAIAAMRPVVTVNPCKKCGFVPEKAG